MQASEIEKNAKNALITNCSLHRHISFSSCKTVFMKSSLLISSETAFNRVSAIDTF